jgi:hypothetical protein
MPLLDIGELTSSLSFFFRIQKHEIKKTTTPSNNITARTPITATAVIKIIYGW